MSSIDRARQLIEYRKNSTSILRFYYSYLIRKCKTVTFISVAKKVLIRIKIQGNFDSKRIKILQSRSKRGKYKKSDVQTIKQMQGLIEKKEYAKSTIKFLGESLTEIQKQKIT